MNDFKKKTLEALVESLRGDSRARAVWEGGSAANGTSDDFSDIDLMIVCEDSSDPLFDVVEAALESVSPITHRYLEPPTTIWPGCSHRLYFLAGAPKHFFVDVAILPRSSEGLLAEFLQVERHGTPVVHFDRDDLIQPRSADPAALKIRQRKRLAEIEGAFPIYRTEVLKELDRGQTIDAFGFYFGGLVRPVVELMGMLHRPFKFDFGLRYLHRTFPERDQAAVERLLFVRSAQDLEARVAEVERMFEETRSRVREALGP